MGANMSSPKKGHNTQQSSETINDEQPNEKSVMKPPPKSELQSNETTIVSMSAETPKKRGRGNPTPRPRTWVVPPRKKASRKRPRGRGRERERYKKSKYQLSTISDQITNEKEEDTVKSIQQDEDTYDMEVSEPEQTPNQARSTTPGRRQSSRRRSTRLTYGPQSPQPEIEDNTPTNKDIPITLRRQSSHRRSAQLAPNTQSPQPEIEDSTPTNKDTPSTLPRQSSRSQPSQIASTPQSSSLQTEDNISTSIKAPTIGRRQSSRRRSTRTSIITKSPPIEDNEVIQVDEDLAAMDISNASSSDEYKGSNPTLRSSSSDNQEDVDDDADEDWGESVNGIRAFRSPTMQRSIISTNDIGSAIRN